MSYLDEPSNAGISNECLRIWGAFALFFLVLNWLIASGNEIVVLITSFVAIALVAPFMLSLGQNAPYIMSVLIVIYIIFALMVAIKAKADGKEGELKVFGSAIIVAIGTSITVIQSSYALDEMFS